MTQVADDASRAPWLKRSTIGLLALLALAGCASVSPQHINTDRMDYGQVVADSWKRQTLLNVVRLRYSDAPVFLDVSSIINSYSVGGKGNVGFTQQTRPDPNIFEIGAEGNWSNTPTVTYQPLMGDRFAKSLLQPVPPSAVFQLMQGGWPADLVLPTVVSSINGLRNSNAGVVAAPDFNQLVAALSRIQRAGGLSIRIEARKDGSAAMMVIRRGDSGTELTEDGRLVQKLLGLEEGVSEFEIAYGLIPKNRSEVAILSRSMLEIMLQLGFGVDLPASHVKEGRALPGRWQEGDEKAKPLVHIHSGAAAPADAYAAVPYKGYWYWIDDTDIASKRTFTFLMILFSLAETGQTTAAPVVTVPSR
jgi:hypothetical protein